MEVSVADAFSALLGTALMLMFLGIILFKLMYLPLTIVCVIAVALMLWGFWTDAFAPLLGRKSD
jgi:hypothetical protein